MNISVIITSYNQKRFLIEAIESVLNQSFSATQIIIVDDNSHDGSQEIIEVYSKKHTHLITPIYHTVNRGVSKSRIDALHAVHGDYVTYLDGDDRYLPDKLKKEAHLIKTDPHCKIAFSNYYIINTNGLRIGKWCDGCQPPQGRVFKQVFARDFPKRNLFRTELIEFDAWKRVGFYDPYLTLYEDFDMRIRLTKQYSVVYHDEPLSEYRCHEKGLSRLKAVYHMKALMYIYDKNRGLLERLTPSEKRYIKKRVTIYLSTFLLLMIKETFWERDMHNSITSISKQLYMTLLQFLKFLMTF